MAKTLMSERQLRELEFHEQYAKTARPEVVSFHAVLAETTRPWNPYWYVIQLVKQQFRSDDQKLLDFGCGFGDYSLQFAKLGYEVTGFDISPRRIAVASELAGAYGLSDKTKFTVQVAERLDYPSESFDLVVGIDILHHVEVEAAALECRRVLKKGGVAIFCEPVEVPYFDALRNTRFGTWLVPKSASFERYITEDERKLTAADVDAIRRHFAEVTIRRFRLISRLDKFVGHVSYLEIADSLLCRWLPQLQAFGGKMVLTLRKT